MTASAATAATKSDDSTAAPVSSVAALQVSNIDSSFYYLFSKSTNHKPSTEHLIYQVSFSEEHDWEGKRCELFPTRSLLSIGEFLKGDVRLRPDGYTQRGRMPIRKGRTLSVKRYVCLIAGFANHIFNPTVRDSHTRNLFHGVAGCRRFHFLFGHASTCFCEEPFLFPEFLTLRRS